VWFFFFQAEDGIRDFHVTGVQTCALPIWGRRISGLDDVDLRRVGRGASGARRGHHDDKVFGVGTRDDTGTGDNRLAQRTVRGGRSEERRVGKEWRSRWQESQSEAKTEGGQ